MSSRSLGTLTVDLIAKIGGFTQGMTQAERIADKKSRDIKRKFDKHAKEIEQTWNGITRALSAGIAGITVGAVFTQMTSIARETANAAIELEKLSTLSNVAAGEFQRLSFGANTVGVSAEKLADIFKDVQDKVGDFAQTGGGGMADFFENIAPKVGVTIDQFRRLSGPEALQLYVSNLEKAKLSQSDMVFYMEAIASDSTMLLPLLRNNAQGFKDIGDAAERAGAIMGADAIAAAKAYKAEGELLEMSMQGVRNEITAQLLPALTEMNRNLTDPATQQGIRNTAGLLADLASKVIGLSNEFFLGMKHADGFWDAVFKYGLANPFKSNAEHVESLKQELADLEARQKKQSFFWTDAQKKEAEAQRKSIQQQIGYYEDREKAALRSMGLSVGLGSLERPVNEALQAPAVLLPSFKKPESSKGKSQAEKDAEAAERFLQSMRDQVQRSQERTAWEQLHYDIQAKGLKLSQDQLNQAQGLATLMDMAKEAELARSTEIDRQNTLYQLQESLMSKAQQYQLELMKYGMGDRAAAELQERVAIMQTQQQELRRMEHEHGKEMRAAETEAQAAHLQAMFNERYALTQEAFEQELVLYDDYIQQKRAKELDWQAGAMAGLQTYLESSRDIYGQTQQIVQNAFGSMEDSVVNFVKTGEFDVRTMVAGIAEDVLRMMIRFGTQMIANKLLGDTLQAAGVATSVAAGAATAAAWAPAAAMASLASFGANAAPASAGIVSTVGLSQGLALLGFADGGWTGAGGKYEVAGLVHRGEGVLNQDDMRALGGPAAFEQFRKGLHGYANGGVVGRPSAPALLPGYGQQSTSKVGDASNVKVVVHNAPEGTRVNQRQVDDEYIVDVMLADAQSGGRFSDYYDSSRGLARIGR